MAVVDAPPHYEANELERVKVSVRAQTFLDVLQGAFQSTWGRPEALSQAMWEVSGTEEAKAGLRCLLSYVEALSPCLSRLCGVGGREGEGGAGRQGKGRRKRRKRGGGGGGSVQEESADEEETVPEQGLSPAALAEDDKRDSDTGEAGLRKGEEAGLVVSAGVGVGVVRGAVRADVASSRSNNPNRRRESSVQGVLGDRDLLGCVLGFMGGATGRQSVRALGQVTLVCRQWKEVSLSEGLWEGVEEELVPVMWEEQQEGRRVVGRDRLVWYGRLLMMERQIWHEYDWSAGLELHVEVFDRMDGLQMLSARGALRYAADNDGDVQISLGAYPDVEVRGAPFSAASRDPEQRRFANIDAYFNRGDYSEYPCSLCVRVTVRDQRTGKGGLLWEEGKRTIRESHEPVLSWGEALPEGSMAVVSEGCRMVGGRHDGLECCTILYICPEPHQEGVAEEDRLYHVATGGVDNQAVAHPFRVMMRSTDTVKVGSLIRSLC